MQFIDLVEFPTIVYVNETGKIIACNHEARVIIGEGCKNVKELVDNDLKVRFHRIIKEKVKNVFTNVVIYKGNTTLEIDVEINPIQIGNEHIMICFFSQSYKMIYQKYLSILIPRLFYKDVNLDFSYCSRYVRLDTKIDLVADIKNEVLLDEEANNYVTELEQGLIENKRSDYNSIHTIKSRDGREHFVKMHRMPIQDGNGDVCGVLGIYTIILSKEEFGLLFDVILRENRVLDRIVSKQECYAVSWRMEGGWHIEYVSSNFVDFEYELLDIYSGTINWRMLVHSEDYERIKQKIEECIENKEKELPVLRYRIRKNSGKYLWVEDSTHSLECIGQTYLREGLLRILPEDCYHKLEKEYGRGTGNEDN